MSGHHHKPHLSQSNKPFKSRHASKSALKDAKKGRTISQRDRGGLKASSSSAGGSTSSAQTASSLKKNRRNHAKQVQLQKRAAADDAAKVFSAKRAPGQQRVRRIVAVVPLTDDVDSTSFVENWLQGQNVELKGERNDRYAECVAGCPCTAREQP